MGYFWREHPKSRFFADLGHFFDLTTPTLEFSPLQVRHFWLKLPEFRNFAQFLIFLFHYHSYPNLNIIWSYYDNYHRIRRLLYFFRQANLSFQGIHSNYVETILSQQHQNMFIRHLCVIFCDKKRIRLFSFTCRIKRIIIFNSNLTFQFNYDWNKIFLHFGQGLVGCFLGYFAPFGYLRAWICTWRMQIGVFLNFIVGWLKYVLI